MIAELCRQELLKLGTQRFPYVLAALVLVIQVARMLATAFTPAETTLDVVTAPQLWAQGAEWGLRFAVYVVMVLGAMAFSREFSLGTAKTILVLPVARWAWVLAKLGALAAVAVGLFLVVALLGVLVVALTIGWQAVVSEGVVLVSAGTIASTVLRAVLLSALFLLPVCAFALLIGLFFTSSGAAVGVAVLASLVLDTAAGLSDAGRLVFLTHLYEPLSLVGKMGRGVPFSWDALVTWGLPVNLVWLALLLGALLIGMGRKDVGV